MTMTNMKTLIFFVFLMLDIYTGLEATDFRSMVEGILNEATDNLQIGSCVSDAKAKAEAATFANLTQDEKSAVSLVNLYTQGCFISKYTDNFYSKLNQQMAICADTADFRFTTFGYLLNEAIDILRNVGYGNSRGTVYRGQSIIYMSEGQTYYPSRFFSTSMSATYAKFFTRECFMIINQASGLMVHAMSDFPGEQEVLLKSTAGYIIHEYINITDDIATELSSLGVSATGVDVLIRMTQTGGLRRRRDTSNRTCTTFSTTTASSVTTSTPPNESTDEPLMNVSMSTTTASTSKASAVRETGTVLYGIIAITMKMILDTDVVCRT